MRDIVSSKALIAQVDNALKDAIYPELFEDISRSCNSSYAFEFAKWIYSFGLIYHYFLEEKSIIDALSSCLAESKETLTKVGMNHDLTYQRVICGITVPLASHIEESSVSDMYAGYYMWGGVPWLRSTIEFILQFYEVELSQLENDCDLEDVDRLTRIMLSDSGSIDSDVPNGMPYTHWWWWGEHNTYRQDNPGKVKRKWLPKKEKRNFLPEIDSPFLLDTNLLRSKE